MELNTIGENIRKFRIQRKLRQEDLAEKTGLSANYIGMVERGHKIPALETFIVIANALEVSSDMLLSGVINTGYLIKSSMLSEKIEMMTSTERDMIFDTVELLMKHVGKIKQQ